MSEEKPKRKRTPPTKPLFTGVKAVKNWNVLEEKAIETKKKPSIVDRILDDMEKKGVESYVYDLNPLGYTGVKVASHAENPRIEVKVLGSSGLGIDRTYQVAIKRLKK